MKSYEVVLLSFWSGRKEYYAVPVGTIEAIRKSLAVTYQTSTDCYMEDLPAGWVHDFRREHIYNLLDAYSSGADYVVLQSV